MCPAAANIFSVSSYAQRSVRRPLDLETGLGESLDQRRFGARLFPLGAGDGHAGEQAAFPPDDAGAGLQVRAEVLGEEPGDGGGHVEVPAEAALLLDAARINEADL